MPLLSSCARNRPAAPPSSSWTYGPQMTHPPLPTSPSSRARRPRARFLSRPTSPSATTACASCLTRTTDATCTPSSTARAAGRASPFWTPCPTTASAQACRSFPCAPPARPSTTAQRRAGTTHSRCAAMTAAPPPTCLTDPSAGAPPSPRLGASSRQAVSWPSRALAASTCAAMPRATPRCSFCASASGGRPSRSPSWRATSQPLSASAW